MVSSSDITFQFSTASGSAGNTVTGAAATSLGTYASTSLWAGGVLNDLFPDITPSQNTAGQIDYRCIFVCNTNLISSWLAVSFWVTQITGGANIAVALDPIGVVALGSSSQQAAGIVNSTTAPSGITFSQPSIGSPLTISSMGPLTCIGIWVQRTVQSNTVPLQNDGLTLSFSGQTF